MSANKRASDGPQRLYLLGHPVGHSKSAVMYNAVYEAAGLPWRYELLDCATEDDARAVLDGRSFLQVNITTPYKPLAFEAADERTEEVCRIGGANVLVNRGGRLIAHNTDGIGCTGFLRREGFRFEGARVAICGTGPTALAILTACARTAAAGIALLGRDAARAQAVLDGWRERGARCGSDDAGDRAEGVSASCYADAAELIAQADLVVNATPLGMKVGDPAPFDGALFHKGQWAFDCVYGHGATAFATAARAAGCRAYDGAGMLVGQAVETVRIVERAVGAEVAIDDDRLFELMADAAGFSLTPQPEVR